MKEVKEEKEVANKHQEVEAVNKIEEEEVKEEKVEANKQDGEVMNRFKRG